MTFDDVNPSLARALAEQGYKEPTPVQSAVLESGAEDRDLLVSAQTGSGKTVAYGLAIAPTILGDAQRLGTPAAPLVLTIAPTRELALQVARELGWLYRTAGGIVVTCVGGMDSRREQRDLRSGAHFVVGTPGRLRDHLERGHLDLSSLEVVVLDEADEMLDLGFKEDLEFILDATPAERRTLLFSATLPKDIVALARTYQENAHRIDTARVGEAHGDIEYRAMRVAPERDRARGGQRPSLLRGWRRPRLLLHARSRPPPPRRPARARVRRRRPIRRDEPARAHRCAAGPAR